MKLILLALILAAGNSYAGSIQKWVDENGNVHYGDTPPVSVPTQTVDVLRPPSNPGKPLPRLGVSSKDSDKVKASANKKSPASQKKAPLSAEQKARACAAARDNLEVLDRNDIIRLRKPDGTERVLSDKEIDQRRARYDQEIKQYCQ